MRFPQSLLAAAIALMVTVTGCSNSDPKSAVDSSKPYNDADVTFATDMIQHHAQALQMVDLTSGRNLDPKVAALAEEIRFAQTPEIEQLVDLLDDWDRQPIPETSRDHTNADGGGGEMDMSVPGMMTGEDMAALKAARGDEFQAKWLDMMIKHHKGAITMASTEKDDGEDKTAVALAGTIVESQNAQVETMRSLLDG